MHQFFKPDMIPVIAMLTACLGLALIGLTVIVIALLGKLNRVKAVFSVGVNAGLLGFGGLCVKIILAALKTTQGGPSTPH